MITYNEASNALMTLCGGKASNWLDILLEDDMSPHQKKGELGAINSMIFEDLKWNGWDTEGYIAFMTITSYIKQLYKELEEQHKMEAL